MEELVISNRLLVRFDPVEDLSVGEQQCDHLPEVLSVLQRAAGRDDHLREDRAVVRPRRGRQDAGLRRVRDRLESRHDVPKVERELPLPSVGVLGHVRAGLDLVETDGHPQRVARGRLILPFEHVVLELRGNESVIYWCA